MSMVLLSMHLLLHPTLSCKSRQHASKSSTIRMQLESIRESRSSELIEPMMGRKTGSLSCGSDKHELLEPLRHERMAGGENPTVERQRLARIQRSLNFTL